MAKKIKKHKPIVQVPGYIKSMAMGGGRCMDRKWLKMMVSAIHSSKYKKPAASLIDDDVELAD